jgi:PQQ-dependent dehydrogenase (methanol/ethanol family)
MIRVTAMRVVLLCALASFAAAALLACHRQDDRREDGPRALGRDKAATVDATPRHANVDEQRLLDADADPDNWMTHGRTYDEQRFSRLSQIDADNVSRLGLAWKYDFDTRRGLEGTPLVVDGVMYISGSWSRVYALRAASGKELWQFDPKVDGKRLAFACCDVVNRGVAVWRGRVYIATLDGRLIALDADNGAVVWDKLIIDPAWPYTSTGAPRIVKGKVIIGNSGADFGVRGYVSVYDAQTGALHWRFYTVPGDPALPVENEIHRKTVKTWTGEWWKLGGGGTVWDAIAYDPQLDLLYIGVGNGGPFPRTIRSPGGGDNLFLSSIVALRPDTGEYVWHYQTTPGDIWDYTATQHMILADLPLDGALRKVIMQAPKNGFFYVLDRATGELISARAYVPVNWASGVDLKTGRPIETELARYDEKDVAQVISPGAFGGHSWQPMSFSPVTRLVYVPAMEMAGSYALDRGFRRRTRGPNTGLQIPVPHRPGDRELELSIKQQMKGALLAWDPAAQRQAWRVEHDGAWNGGVLSTAGNLVFQGDARGYLSAYRADDGKRVWSFYVQTGVVAPPISYAVDGKQYVAVLAGWGGAYPMALGGLSFDPVKIENVSRVLAFSLDGRESLPPRPASTPSFPASTTTTLDESAVAAGDRLFAANCAMCHGYAAVSGGLVPDLRHSALAASRNAWAAAVLNGALASRGMPSFQGELTEADAESLRAYVIQRARSARGNL